MKLYSLTITPLSGFLTMPKGDILYGQILSFLSFSEDIEKFKDNFVVSDMMPYNFFYKPNLPLKYFNEEDKKKLRKKRFISLKSLQNDLIPEEINFYKKDLVIKNSISRLTFTTSDGFDPFSSEEFIFNKMWMFLMCEDDKKDFLIETIKKVGEYGFGKKSSVGKGNFKVEEVKEFDFGNLKTNTYLAISPFVKSDDEVFYEPYVKFGKYGLNRAKNPFKKPVILCDSGSVIKLQNNQKIYGKILENGSVETSYTQAKTILVPMKDIK